MCVLVFVCEYMCECVRGLSIFVACLYVSMGVSYVMVDVTQL